MTIVGSSRISSSFQAELRRFVKQARREIGLRDVSVLLTTTSKMRTLNRKFRKKDKATDVLSFPACDGASSNYSGDIAISTEIARAQARRYGHSFEHELQILLLHGLLHLAGYDHEQDNGEMIRRERLLRTKLGLPESLTERSAGSGRTNRSRQP